MNGEAIFATRPIAPYEEGQVVFTHKGDKICAIYLTKAEREGLPAEITPSLIKPKPGSKVSMLGVGTAFAWETGPDGVTKIQIPALLQRAPPCRHAFAFSIVQ